MDFIELEQTDGQVIIINKAYVVNVLPAEGGYGKGAAVYLNTGAAGVAVVNVVASDVNALRRWLLPH